MQIIHITDCQGSNAKMRLNTRIRSLFPDAEVEHVGISHVIEAAGDMIDALDALRLGEPGIIISNIAPRGSKEEYPNGVPFCFQNFEGNILIGTPHSFYLLKKFGLISKINQTDVLEVCEKFLDKDEASRIANSQFRSYEYLPLLAKWLSEKKEIPSQEIEVPDLEGNYVWCTNRFTENPEDKKNCKTTALEVSEFTGERFVKLPFYERLTDVPKGDAAIIRGSSGYKTKKFLEIVVQGASASKTFDLEVGSKI